MKLLSLFCLLAIVSTIQVPAAESTVTPEKEIQIDTLVIPSRNHTRMQPEIFYAFNSAVKDNAPMMKMTFTLFNPFQAKFTGKSGEKQSDLMELLQESVYEVAAIKKANPSTVELMEHIEAYIKENPESNLAKTHEAIDAFFEPYEFLIIESSDTYGAHPIFYQSGVTDVDLPSGANEKDIIETIYGLFFIDAAFAQDKLVWGTCHGSQIGYIHAGGRLGRLFEFKEDGYGDVELKIKKGPNSPVNEEIWRIGKHLYTQDKGSDYKDYGVIPYPVPKEFGRGEGVEGKYINKDFQHSLALVEPIPSTIDVISYHPLSNYTDRIKDGEAEPNGNFSEVLKDQKIVDAYRYHTMIGMQYHPQYTYDDLETAIIFDYLVESLEDKYSSLEPLH